MRFLIPLLGTGIPGPTLTELFSCGTPSFGLEWIVPSFIALSLTHLFSGQIALIDEVIRAGVVPQLVIFISFTQ